MNTRPRILSASFLILFGAVALLAGCHTIAGAGEDISKTGKAIEKTAEKATP